jgi:hypothetical protein
MFHQSGLTRKAEINIQPLIVKKNVREGVFLFSPFDLPNDCGGKMSWTGQATC